MRSDARSSACRIPAREAAAAPPSPAVSPPTTTPPGFAAFVDLSPPWCGKVHEHGVLAPARARTYVPDPAGCGLRRGGFDARGGAEGVGAVGALPGEVLELAAEVAVGGGLLEDRPVQVEVLAEGAGAHVELGL